MPLLLKLQMGIECYDGVGKLDFVCLQVARYRNLKKSRGRDPLKCFCLTIVAWPELPLHQAP